MSDESKRKTVGYNMGPEDEETFEDVSSPKVGLRSKSLAGFKFGYSSLTILILIITTFILAFQCISLARSVNQNLAENKANETNSKEALTKAIETSRQAAEDSLNNQKTLLNEISQNLKLVQTKIEAVCPDVDFLAVAQKTGTDKVNTHVYHRLYEPYIKPFRCQPIKILEIGLGCDMPYGPGASYYLWLEYLPSAEIYFIEFDKACAEKWQNTNDRVKVFSGDQADKEFLQKFIETTGGQFDFIVDDGGHTMNQQITSLEVLFSAIKPGGVYFLEDLLTSYMLGRYNGGGDSDKNTTVNYIKDMMSDFMTRRANLQPNKKPLSKEITRIDCVDELCAFTKKK